MGINDLDYPIYIISKGRWESRLTSRALEEMNVPYRIVIEPQEYEQYAAVIDPSKILVLPFSNLGQGSIPARNWVWEHSVNENHKRHWILDDNIEGFYRFHDGMRIKMLNNIAFKAVEDFADRYLNLMMAGLHYHMFGITSLTNAIKKPVQFNRRIYSCILLDNTCRHRWRGKYNEDTDLSLRILKDGDCTALFYAFLANKIATQKMSGGNTDELYAQTNNRYEFALSLYQQHPDVVKITKKWGRWHHQVDYRPFRGNKLIRNPDAIIPEGINDYGMRLIRRDNPDPDA